MMRKFATILAALAFGLTTLVPATASAQHRGGYDRGGHDRGGYDRGRGRGHYGDGCRRDNNYGCERDRDNRRYGRGDNDDAIAAGVIGIVLGAVIASAVSNSNNNDRRDDGYYDRDDDYYRGGDYRDEGYYNEPPPPPECTRRERQWDRYANRYVTVDVPC